MSDMFEGGVEHNVYHGALVIGDYRYNLYRIWDFEKPRVTWIMLNPSTADADNDDPTIRRCIGFSKKFGYGGMSVVNLFPYRAANPKDLMLAKSPDGPTFRNKNSIQAHTGDGRVVICAWGAHGNHMNRAMWTASDLQERKVKLWRLGSPTKSGQPRHPLYLSKDTELERHG